MGEKREREREREHKTQMSKRLKTQAGNFTQKTDKTKEQNSLVPAINIKLWKKGSITQLHTATEPLQLKTFHETHKKVDQIHNLQKIHNLTKIIQQCHMKIKPKTNHTSTQNSETTEDKRK